MPAMARQLHDHRRNLNDWQDWAVPGLVLVCTGTTINLNQADTQQASSATVPARMIIINDASATQAASGPVTVTVGLPVYV